MFIKEKAAVVLNLVVEVLVKHDLPSRVGRLYPLRLGVSQRFN